MTTVNTLYFIGCGSPEQRASQQETATAQNMGFKAYNLLRMADLGLPVPAAFVLGTAWCADEVHREKGLSHRHLGAWPSALQSRLGQTLADRVVLCCCLSDRRPRFPCPG